MELTQAEEKAMADWETEPGWGLKEPGGRGDGVRRNSSRGSLSGNGETGEGCTG